MASDVSKCTPSSMDQVGVYDETPGNISRINPYHFSRTHTHITSFDTIFIKRSSSQSSKPQVCKYFLNNACRFGSNCRFSHDRSLKPNMVCSFFLVGRCAYGDRCRYDHVRPATEVHKSSVGESSRSGASRPQTGTDVQNNTDRASSSRKTKFNIHAPEFVPLRARAPQNASSYASAAGSIKLRELCPYFVTGHCNKGSACDFVHGFLCDYCNDYVLHPFDSEQRKRHIKECVEAHEKHMKEAFAFARSQNKVCGICMENIRESKKFFGILEKCKHCFCFDCIQRWRANKTEQFAKSALRACPECRVASSFIVSSKFWVESDDEKKELIKNYKERAKKKPCKFVQRGRLQDCPFGSRCFYNHDITPGITESDDSKGTNYILLRALMSDFPDSFGDDFSGDLSAFNSSQSSYDELFESFSSFSSNWPFELAREVVDTIRRQTNAPLKICMETASSVISTLKDLNNEQIVEIGNCFSQDFMDYNDCYDARLLNYLEMLISATIEDKQQQIWSVSDNMNLIRDLHSFSSVLETTDPRVAINRLNRDSYDFVQKLVTLYQIEQETDVRIVSLEALYSCSKLDSSFRSFLLNSQLPILLVINNKYSSVLSSIEEWSLKVLSNLFSGEEKPPIICYDYFTVEFVEKILNLCDRDDRLAFQFLVNFNNHFDEGRSLVVQCLRDCKSLLFGQILIEELNNRRNGGEIEDRTVKMVVDIFLEEPEIVSKVFYHNDLVVLYDILIQDLLDSPISKRTRMILRVFEKLIELRFIDANRLVPSLKTLHSLKEVDDDYKFHVESILVKIASQ